MATENDLLSRIEGLEIRFQEITSLITAPDIIADQKRFMKLSKEYRDLERILDKGKEYRNLLGNIQEGRDTLEAESDPELRAMAREMMQEAEQRIPSLEEEIKLLLIPADPEDAKNVVMEIRGGTGGDEAALFAGDLYKMYVRYCEGRGWTTEVTSMSEGTAGRKSSSRSREMVSMGSSSMRAVCTVCSVSQRLRLRDVCIPPLLR